MSALPSAKPRVIELSSLYAEPTPENRPGQRPAASLPALGTLVTVVGIALIVAGLVASRKGKPAPRRNRAPAMPAPDTDRAKREQQRLIDESRKVVEKTRRLTREHPERQGE